LVEEGKLGLDDPLSKYFQPSPESWKQVTIRELLSHTGGFTDYPDHFDFRHDRNEEELLKIVQGIPLAYPPGTKESYANLGYLTLGILIHRVTGQFYGDFLRDRIFQPLGMSTAHIINEADIVPNRAAGYRLVKGELKNQEWVSPALNTTADGSLYLTVQDMAKWDAALYTDKLLRRSSLDMMWTPVKLNDGKTQKYGFGWGFGDTRGHRIIEHGGAWQGFTTYIARYVDDKLTIIVLTNLAGANPGKIAHGIAGLDNAELAPAEPAAVQIDPNIFDAYAGEYQLGHDLVIRVFREGDRFWVQAGEQQRLEIFPESESKFFLKAVEARITFVKDATGKVTHLILHQTGDVEAKKIK